MTGGAGMGVFLFICCLSHIIRGNKLVCTIRLCLFFVILLYYYAPTTRTEQNLPLIQARPTDKNEP